MSYLRVSPQGRQSNDLDASGTFVSKSFTDTSKLWIADFVWKWAPNGNTNNTSFKLQGEFLHRNEDGTFNTDHYAASQDGWFLQGIYKFLPNWRAGLRYEQLDSGRVDYGVNSANLATTAYDPKLVSAMVDYNPSEFLHIRLQISQDKSRQDATDN